MPPVPAFAIGTGLTVIVLIADAGQPAAEAEFTVYVIEPVDVGVALTIEPLEADKPPPAEDTQEYVLAVAAVNEIDEPKHKLTEGLEVIATVGVGFTVTV